MLPVLGVPKCVAFRSEHNGSYLRYVHDSDKPLLDLSGTDCISPYTRFYLEASKEHEGLVHIRCCYNNTYWVAQKQQLDEEDGGGSSWIIGTADEPEDDLSKPSCTLFKLNPATQDDPQSVRLLYAQLGKHACMISSSDKANNQEANYLHVRHDGTGEDNTFSAYTVVQLSQEKELPKYLAFKGDNGRYLSAKVIQGYNYLEFSSNDIGDPTVHNTTITNANGTVRIKNLHFGRFWRRSPNWIWADSSDTTNNNRDTLFSVTKIDDKHFALKNLGNDHFCKRLTTEGKTSCLNASTKTITVEAKLNLEEAIISREIYNVEFNVSKARIYGEKPLFMSRGVATNNTTESNIYRVTLEFSETEKNTWDSNVSWKLTSTAKLTSGIPLIANGKVEVKNEFSANYQWSSTIEKTTNKSVEYSVTVPPKTRVTINMIATVGSCDVPFSYTQKDLLYDGRVVINKMEDGIYTGVNCYNFKYETEEERI